MKSSPASQESSPSGTGDLPRHRKIYAELLREIRSGLYKPGDRLPSEAVLCERFGASRITVAKAIQTLQNENFVNRRPGSGTYVQAPRASSSLHFGLLIPDLGRTEIFEPICQGMMTSPLGKSHSLVWGYSAPTTDNDHEHAAEQLCHQFISQKVSGVFFAPLEYTSTRDEANRRIIAALKRAHIPVVLLDRCFETYPMRSPYDLVGIDNHRAGYALTRHLQQHGAKRILFAARPHSASTVDERIAGYFEALREHSTYAGCASRIDVNDPAAVAAVLEAERPDAIICANDLTAARLMKSLEDLGVSIPGQIRLVGVDDVQYAKFLPVGLTTIRQDCDEIGSVAISVMLDRIERPSRPPRDVLVHFDLVVRQSCGSHLGRDSASDKLPPSPMPPAVPARPKSALTRTT